MVGLLLQHDMLTMQFDGPITRTSCFNVACISMKEKVIQHGPIYTMFDIQLYHVQHDPI